MARTWRVIVGSDEADYHYKEALKSDLACAPRVSEAIDVGINAGQHTRYPSVAIAAVGRAIGGESDRALLVSGTGLGVSMTAHNVLGIRAAAARESYSVEHSIFSNNAQVFCFGQRMVGLELTRRLKREWLGYEFDEGAGMAVKVTVIKECEAHIGDAN